MSWSIGFLWVSLSLTLADTVVDATGHTANSVSLDAELLDTAQATGDPNVINHGSRQIAWLKSKGGFVHENFEIRRADREDDTSRFAVFAKDDIAADDLILRIPRSCLVATFNDDICDTVELLTQEMRLGNESKFEPYITYLKSQAYGQLPTMWTEKGKALLNEMLGDGELPPSHATSVNWGCHDENAPLDEQQAAALIIQRGWDEVLIPVYDMMSHRNGEQWLNTRLAPDGSVHDQEEDVHVYASRKIYKDEEIYTTYDQCEDCGGRSDYYGTAEIARDYGFVEMLPQKWVFPQQRVSFGLDYEYDDTGRVANEDSLVFKWYSTKPETAAKAVPFFKAQIARLQEFEATRLQTNDYKDAIPAYEFELVELYHAALLRAMSMMVEEVKDETGVPGVTDKEKIEAAVVDGNVDHGQRQMQWVRSKGGFVSSKMEIRKLSPGDPESVYGMFATEDMKEGETLLTIPRDCLVATFDDNACDTVDLLAREMALGSDSEFEPYVTYLKETQPYGQLPALWSEKGKRLLLKVVMDVGEDGDGELHQVLPPAGVVNSEWIGCKSFSEQTPMLEKHAAALVHQRGWDEVLIPVYDMMSHRNGDRWLNTRESHSVHDQDKPVQVEAARDIKKGEEIYTTYDSCFDCGGRSNDYGTAQILRDYGFVETMPQKWVFDDPNLIFTLDYKYNEDGRVEDEEDLEVTIIQGDSSDENIEDFLEDQFERLEYMKYMDLLENDSGIPEYEWNTIVQYARALSVALSAVSEKLREEGTCVKEDGDTSSCSISDSRYNPLTEMFDDEGYNQYVCDIDWSFPGYNPLETIKSQYQKTYFIKHPENQDVCFELDSTWQICGSYRPHYHEMATHYAASFLPEIKRVLWVGGGDSMLLHEVLKYPSLELAVGLELDQKVTRGSFKHFGTQPHFDNDKVEWYFGDAAKSLLMLPKEYFGTFDLLLCDMSETVMSNSVTDGLDILDALSLLLKPEGIFVKNEIYLDKMKTLFKHSMQLHVYDVPVLCSQSFILGSNKINFLNETLTDHELVGKNLFFKPPSALDYRYFEVHDYVKNPNPQRVCKDPTKKTEEEPETQDKSPGIIMVLEAENAKMGPLSADEILAALVPALESAGLSVVSTFTSQGTESEKTTTVVLREGYVIARSFAADKYIGFDVHMWSAFHKIDEVKQLLLTAAQSDGQTASSFKIVAGGMFGAESWKEDSLKRGPELQPCEIADSVPRNDAMSWDDIAPIIQKSLDLLPNKNAVAAVVCGPKDRYCGSVDLATNHGSVSHTVTLHTCPSIEGGHEYQADSGNLKYACEQEILGVLHELSESGEKVDSILLDPSADYSMAQVVHRIISRTRNKRMFFSEHLLVLAPIVDTRESWRRVFVDQFREIYDIEPVFRSEVLFNTTDSSMEMGTFLAGDTRYIQHVLEVTDKIEESGSGLIGEPRNFEAGRFPFVHDPQPTLFALPGDYDQSGPLEQWTSQKALGRQTVIQMENSSEGKKIAAKPLSKESVRSLLDGAITGLKIEPEWETPKEFMDLGDGCILFNSWDGGSIVVLWDGRNNITINIFTSNEDSEKVASDFTLQFKKINSSLKVVLRDLMPRGTGRVINFKKDIDDMKGSDPHWAGSVQ